MSDLVHGALEVFGAGCIVYWAVRLAIRHEVKR